MTKIKRLIMHGFKTFGKRTVLEFGDTFNTIIGPNGSGKSNVIDAVCFVLGRSSAKSMRAENLSALVYNGGKKGKAAKEAEVSIVFDNSDKIFPVEADEVKVSRFVKSAGNSVYKVNDKTKTRQEMLTILSAARIDPDGYNIVLQDDISSFISMSSINKRMILEEAAGISVYRERKEKAEQELLNVEQRTKDAQIILEERKQYMDELRKDREEALKFKEVSSEMERLKFSLLHKEKEKKSAELSQASGKVAESEENIHKKNEEIKSLKEKTAKNKEHIKEITKTIEDKGEKEQVEMNRELEQKRIEMATLVSEQNNFNEQLRTIASKEENVAASLKDLQANIKSLEEKKKEVSGLLEREKSNREKVEADIKRFNDKLNLGSLDEINKEIESIDAEAEGKSQEIQSLREKQQSFIREKDRLEMELDGIDSRISKMKQVEKQHKEEIEEIKKLKEEFKKDTMELAGLLNEDSMIANKLIKLRKKLVELKEKEVKLNIKDREREEMLSRNIAIKKVLELKQQKPGIYGTVSELGSASKEHELALSIAAGSRMNQIVVENDEIAAECIRFLKENKLGTASFIPLNKIKFHGISQHAKEAVAKVHGIVGPAINLIKFDSRYRKAFEYVFGATLVIDNIDTARKIGIGNVRMVTLDGDLAEVSGVMFGGHVSKGKVAARFKDENVRNELSELIQEINETSGLINSMEGRKSEIGEKIDLLRAKKAELEGEIIKREKSLYLQDSDLSASAEEKERIGREVRNLDEMIANNQAAISSLLKEITDLKGKKQLLRDKLSEISDLSKLAELRAYEESKKGINERVSGLEGEISRIDTKLEVLQHDKESSESVLKDLDKQKGEFEKKLKEVQLRVKALKEEISEKENVVKKFYSEFKELFEKRNKLENEIQDYENKASQLDNDAREIERAISNIRYKEAQLKTEIDALGEEMKQFKELEPISLSERQIKARLAELEQIIASIGAVNMRAIEVFEQAEKEFNDLVDRIAKLSKEREDVLGLISEIESKRKDKFIKTFESINNSFQAIFQKLAPKGEAFLEMENPAEPFEGGLKIKVRLNKSRFIELRSLSGGEKTLTSLSFIFALQDYEPSTFYVFDEVDSALDKVNSKELAGWIKEYSKKAQYVVISHNDEVLSDADFLYGVSMDKEVNLSKIISLKVEG
ncbi:MAG TPA: chromosome segregation protein SMC [Candidatus Woesearchaeota archaeon]|nr:chromosome segregation protein SMC [Candidatus Woesearchaeota archaeon]